MLFDLRSRGRRRTVQVIYGGLAVLMLGGLVLFGVGAGKGGGLLNAFTNNGTNSQPSVINKQIRAAIKLTQKEPNSPAAWAGLVEARFSAAGEGNNYNTVTGEYAASGKKQLALTAAPWAQYLKLTHNKPTITVANTMARSYAALAQYANEATAWEYVANLAPGYARAYECLAASAFAAKQTRKGTLAEAKALTLVPKLNKLTVKQQLESAKTDPTVAQSC